MNNADKERVRDIVVKHLSLHKPNIMDNCRIMQDLGGDSLDCIEIGMALEDEFQITITDAWYGEHPDPSVQDFIDMVGKARG